MIKRKVYILITIIALSLTAISTFTIILLDITHRELQQKATESIISTIQQYTKRQAEYSMKHLSEKITGKSVKQQINIIKKFIEPSEHNKTSNYRACVFDSQNKILAFISKDPSISKSNEHLFFQTKTLVKNIQMMKARKLKSHTYTEMNSNKDIRLVVLALIPSTDFFYCVDFNIKGSKKTLKFVLEPFMNLKKTYVWALILSCAVILIIIFFVSAIILKQIKVIEDEKRKEKIKIKKTNTLLSVEIGIRERIEKELKEANRELKRLSARDGLTGISNRRSFDEHLETEIQRMARNATPLSLIICDIDFFKNYNDTYGHHAGDDCLKEVAMVINAAARRPADIAARYGGEEFAIILPETDKIGASFIAETIRKNIQNLEIEHRKSPVHTTVTISAGITSLIPDQHTTPALLIKRADTALYKAKELGRNRVEKS